MPKPKNLRRPRLDASLTAEDQYIYQRTSPRQEHAYRQADRDDAYVARLRLARGGIVASILAGVSHG